MEITGPDNYLLVEVYWFDNGYLASKHGVALSGEVKSKTLGWKLQLKLYLFPMAKEFQNPCSNSISSIL